MDLQTILSWFKRGCKPTEAQFAATFRSFRHKDDPVPMEDVAGLAYTLANKSDKGHTHTLAEITDYDGGDKEVLNAMVANDTAELEAFTKTVGMYYILLADHTLHQYVHDEDTDTDTLIEVDPDGKVVYSAYDADDNLHIYLYNVPNMEFQDVTNEQVNKTIYTNDLDTLITRQLKNGIYSVVHINSGIDGNIYGDAYTLTVGDGSVFSRVLECRSGWAQAVLIDESYQWEWHRYAYTGHRHQMSDVEELPEALGNKQDKTDNSLLTTAKTVIGAINELWTKFKDYLKGIQHVTYAQLKTMRDSGTLVAGQWYRITDYMTTVANDPEARSAGHPFDLLVMATNENTLSEEAKAIKSTRDTEGYFANSNLDAWKIWYCLDNDATRFAWADEENGTGVIYRMIDEWQNDCPYDLKNIQYKRCRSAGEYMSNVINNYDWQNLQYLLSAEMDGHFNAELYIEDSANYIWLYTFNYIPNVNEPTNITDASLIVKIDNGNENAYYNKACHCNEIKPYYSVCIVDKNTSIIQCLNDIVMWSTDEENAEAVKLYGNNFNTGCFSMSFGEHCFANTFGSNCRYVIGIKFYYNTFGNDCGANTFGNGVSWNTFGNDCWNNTFGNNCFQNTFGNYFQYNTFGNNVYYNTFGNYVRYLTVFDGVHYVAVTGGSSDSSYIQNAQILNGTMGSDTNNRLQISFQASANYCQIAGLNSSGNLRIWTPADAY